MGSRMAQVEVMPEQFVEAMRQVKGPPTLKWCQAVAPCLFCVLHGEQCDFEEPMPGLWWNTLHAACITVEQGWDWAWVVAQLEKGWWSQVSGRVKGAKGGGSAGHLSIKIGPLQGG
ncbi:hypothetical protein C0989_007389 [Termitomyces sp. Mn162]|nr:hypothetical protein C0989_007389 [Termitomyces sp. Mn162]